MGSSGLAFKFEAMRSQSSRTWWRR